MHKRARACVRVPRLADSGENAEVGLYGWHSSAGCASLCADSVFMSAHSVQIAVCAIMLCAHAYMCTCFICSCLRMRSDCWTRAQICAATLRMRPLSALERVPSCTWLPLRLQAGPSGSHPF